MTQKALGTFTSVFLLNCSVHSDLPYTCVEPSLLWDNCGLKGARNLPKVTHRLWQGWRWAALWTQTPAFSPGLGTCRSSVSLRLHIGFYISGQTPCPQPIFAGWL